MNGKKKAFASGFVVAFLLCGLVGGLVTKQSLGYVWRGYPYTASPVNWDGSDIVFYNNWSLTVPSGFVADLESIVFYCDNYSAGVTIHAAIYDSDYVLIYESEDVAVLAMGWYTMPIVGTLLDGDYNVGVGMKDGICYGYTEVVGTVSKQSGGYGFSLVPTVTTLGDGNWSLSCYGNYHLDSVYTGTSGSTEVTMLDMAGWGSFFVSLFLIAVNLVLALKSRSWAVNFLFGLVTVGYLSWVFVNAVTEVFGGWLLYMVLIADVLVLVKGAVLVRASGV